MPRPLLPWLRPAPAPIAAATVQRSSSVKPTCTSGAFRLALPTRTSSNSANRKCLFPMSPTCRCLLSSFSLSEQDCRPIWAVALYLFIVAKTQVPTYKNSFNHVNAWTEGHRKKVTVLSYREEYGPINGDGKSASLVCREVIVKCCTRTRGQLT